MAGFLDRRRRWLRRLAWLSMAGSLALTVTSFLSFYSCPAYVGSGRIILLIGGGVLVEDVPANQPRGFRMTDAFVTNADFIAHLRGWFTMPQGMGSVSLFIQLGPSVAILAAVSSFMLWRTRRRIPEGLCQACGYDLTGNESGRCSIRSGDIRMMQHEILE